MNSRLKILAVPGSLRKDSSSFKLLNIISTIVATEIEFSIYEGIGSLPHFDDKEGYQLVDDWRKQLREADGIIICTPEYAFGVPGSLKNALDWIVSSGEFYNKPVALITASSSGDKAHASLLYTLDALSANMNEGTKLLVSFIRSRFVGEDKLNTETQAMVENVFSNLIQLVKATRPENVN